jgi:hypothetical protein
MTRLRGPQSEIERFVGRLARCRLQHGRDHGITFDAIDVPSDFVGPNAEKMLVTCRRRRTQAFMAGRG